MADALLDDVGDLLREAADQVVLPLFRKLDDADVSEKAPGEIVTVADRRAEELIAAGLRQLLPGSLVVGEEGVADDPGLLRHLRDGGDVWLVDPVDGTANFAAGRRPFALMVALLTEGRPVAGWILDPLGGILASGRADDGTLLNGRPVGDTASVPRPGELRGAAMTRFLPPDTRDRVRAGGRRLGELLPGQHCAGREYLDILIGEQQFALFWRTLPWDHAPGALLVRAAGGVARRFDGVDYHPADEGHGLLVAANEEVWAEVHDALLGT
ncbi:inositol monophosphatase family protein [Micromonospora sp. CV4]|uniref:inositol monophosphatase family protein n=1 Tax=Micromonospora sp. CV4 TaxID=2478711 RepID=UPI000EF51B41|nr:inositol monophosphatase family protein [Micromonospora sp. CV4]RLP92361.1 inositol monophosphatase [Micromonospora sp. CV4]RLP92368.1 inositol monophosphatase [Micromonospora sp. CV4]